MESNKFGIYDCGKIKGVVELFRSGDVHDGHDLAGIHVPDRTVDDICKVFVVAKSPQFADGVARPMDQACNSFPTARGLVSDFEEYQALLGRFFAHVEAKVLRIAPMGESHRTFYQGRALHLLDDV